MTTGDPPVLGHQWHTHGRDHHSGVSGVKHRLFGIALNASNWLMLMLVNVGMLVDVNASSWVNAKNDSEEPSCWFHHYVFVGHAVTELWSDGHQTLVALRALAQHPDGRAITGRNVLMYWTYLEVS